MSFERSFNKPVEEGKEYELDIKETKPGDHVKVKINSVGPRFATGEVVQ